MIFKLPADRKGLQKEQLDKIDALSVEEKKNWYGLFDSYLADRHLYQTMIDNYKSLPPDQLNETIHNKKQLETDLPLREQQLLKMLNLAVDSPADMSDEQKKLIRLKNFVKHGSVVIRPQKDDAKIYTLKEKTPIII